MKFSGTTGPEYIKYEQDTLNIVGCRAVTRAGRKYMCISQNATGSYKMNIYENIVDCRVVTKTNGAGHIYPFLNFNGATVEGLEWISKFVPHFSGHVIINHAGIKVNPC